MSNEEKYQIKEFKEYSLESDGDKLTLHFRSGRLLQVFYATEFSLLFIIIQRVALEYWGQVAILSVISILLSSVYFLAKKRRVNLGATVLLGTLTLTLTYFMWDYGGTRDETLLAYPGILVFAVIIGNRKLFMGLLIFMLTSVLLNGYLNSEGIYINKPGPPDLESAALLSTVICLVSFSIWLLSNDIRRLLLRLARENQRVVNSQKEIQDLIHHDALTKLPNRVFAREHFNNAVLKSLRNENMTCVMFLDLDNFKNINDSLGHQIGDKFLVALSEKLVECFRRDDCVCRLGGDEFMIILDGVNDRDQLIQLIDKVISKVKEPIQVVGNSICVTSSIGIAIAPNDGKDFDGIFQKADMAMYRAKDLGKNNFCFYDNQMNVEAQANISLIADMQAALDHEEFYLVYQPKIDLKRNRIVGAEALIRWRHKTSGLISPATFIPLAESSGKIIDIGAWVLKKAIRQASMWQAGGDRIPVAVNISSVQFRRSNMAAHILSLLEETSLPGELLELELTESLLFDHSGQLKQALSRLKQEGIKFSIDDFGTGYSNLGYLKNFEVDTLKVDQSFVRKIEQNPEDLAIARAIIQMAKGLNMLTIAEGIETESVATVFRQLGCDAGQGYLWAKPLLPDEFVHFVRNFQGAHVIEPKFGE